MKLNLGCGNSILSRYINLDIVKNKGVDLVHNLNVFPYPFEDNQFDEILMSHVLEHLMYPQETMKEVYRMLKKDGKLIIRFPHYTHPNAWLDLDHKRALTEDIFRYFYYEKPLTYNCDTPQFSKFEYKYIPTKFGKYIPYAWLKLLRHFCNVLILDVEVILIK